MFTFVNECVQCVIECVNKCANEGGDPGRIYFFIGIRIIRFSWFSWIWIATFVFCYVFWSKIIHLIFRNISWRMGGRCKLALFFPKKTIFNIIIFINSNISNNIYHTNIKYSTTQLETTQHRGEEEGEWRYDDMTKWWKNEMTKSRKARKRISPPTLFDIFRHFWHFCDIFQILSTFFIEIRAIFWFSWFPCFGLWHSGPFFSVFEKNNH